MPIFIFYSPRRVISGDNRNDKHFYIQCHLNFGVKMNNFEKLERDTVKASKLLSDIYSIKILSSTYNRPRSAQELSLKFDIPIASCYRRIHELEKAGLMCCTSRVLTNKGKRLRLYQSQVNGIYLYFQYDKVKVKLNPIPSDFNMKARYEEVLIRE